MGDDRAYEAFLASFQTDPVAPVQTWPGPGGSNPLDDLRRYAEILKQLPARPARIEVSDLAYAALRTVAAESPIEMTWSNPLFRQTGGVPVFIDKDLPVGAWRMLDVDGNVIREGTMLPDTGERR